MGEKYYVVSESELESLLAAAYADGADGATNVAETHLAACRARPVPEGATHFYARHIEPSSGDYETPIGWFKEIKR